MSRGKIHNYARARQQIDMSGLRWGKITPTDLDAVIEYHDSHYVLGEYKLLGTEYQYGQRLAHERMTDDLEKTKPTLLFLAEHDTPTTDDIDGANTFVSHYRRKGIWKKGRNQTVKETIELFFKGGV